MDIFHEDPINVILLATVRCILQLDNCGNAIHFCIFMVTLNNLLLLSIKTNSNKTGMYCSVATSTIVMQNRHNIVLYLHCLCVVVFACTQIKAWRLPLREFCLRNNQLVACDLGGKFAPHLYHNYVHKHIPPLNYVRALPKTDKLHLSNGEELEFECII
jgi:hypothetical protein